MAKEYKELTFTDNFMFCKVITHNPDLCRHMLELILGKPIRRGEIKAAEKVMTITPEAKSIRLDVYWMMRRGRYMNWRAYEMDVNIAKRKAREEGWKEGQREGQKEGQKEGRKEGDLSRSRQSIFDLLEDLGEIPADICSRVNAEEDTELLRVWHKAAARAGSFDEFRECMR